MRTYNDVRNEVVRFIHTTDIGAFDFARVCKDLCTCSKCKYYCQHYDKDGRYVDFGHCIRNSGNHPTRPHNTCCGSWDCDEIKEQEE